MSRAKSKETDESVSLNIQHYPWQKAALAHVDAQLADNRQPHATLFRLRKDYDDTMLGWQVIKRIICDSHRANDDCKHCRMIDDALHPNVLFLDVVNTSVDFAPVKRIGIDDVRQIEQKMWQTSMFDKPKIAYINGMDLLSTPAQNALLKTLEEPPENTFFILAVTDVSHVLPTIMSRVQRLHHSTFPQERLLYWLQQQLNQQSNQPMTEAEIAKVAKLADDAPMRSLALLQSPDLVQQLSREKAQFADFITGKNSAQNLAATFEKGQESAQLARYCRYTENMIHFLFTKSVERHAEANDKMANKTGENSVQYATWKGVSLRALYRLHDTLMELRRLTDTNVNVHLQLTTSLTDWQYERSR